MDYSLINEYENKMLAGLLREFRTYLVPDIKKRIQDVRQKQKLWHAVLKDLDQRKSKVSSVHLLEREIRDFVSRLQNVLETYFNEYQRRRGRSIMGKFIDEFKFFKMADLDVKEINMQIRMTSWYLDFVGALSKTETQLANENPETEIRQKLRRSIFDSGENDIVVKDPRLRTIKSSLLDGKDGVIRIYGRGGIGKTVLAHKLYSSPSVQSHFYICSAVEIGPEFALRNVLESIVVQLPEGRERVKQPDLTLETVAEHFKEYGKNMRYLFVLDDIRSLDEPDGLDEQDGLDEPDGFVHVMRRLSPFDSFQLFQKTFLRDPYGLSALSSILGLINFLSYVVCNLHAYLMLVDIYIMDKMIGMNETQRIKELTDAECPGHFTRFKNSSPLKGRIQIALGISSTVFSPILDFKILSFDFPARCL
ncbi:disease resistance protein RPP13-like [Olea europaea var. sylvestris]|uniref:disease resistance protein RPP13-like n=1 Tax=Olea europaea var. sylvestris TaxID=158386 RepID=UPI000C1D67AF|nr:disease resistance protein RPP13-like [Olea europaea var. sylvestris]